MPFKRFFLEECAAAHECSEESWAREKGCQSFIRTEACLENFKDHLCQSPLHYLNSDEKVAEYMDKAASMVLTEELPDDLFEPPPPPIKKRRHAYVEHSGTPARKAPPEKARPRHKAPQVKEPPPAFASSSTSSSATSMVQLANAVDTVKVSKASIADLNTTVVRKQETLVNARDFFMKCASVLENEAEEMDATAGDIRDIMARSSTSMDVD
jgi:hypothetical protein